MAHPPQLFPVDNAAFYIDSFNRVYNPRTRKPVRCKICNSHIEYAENTLGFHCSDNLKHKIEYPWNRDTYY